ncbi:hypothetical protein ACHAXS_013797 [Conticribra weissflogii]
MEYDRALYRVYERIMEDLNSSPALMSSSSPPVASTDSLRTASPRQHQRGRRNHRSSQRRRLDSRRDAMNEEQVEQDRNENSEQGDNVAEMPTSENDGRRENNISSEHRQVQDTGSESVHETAHEINHDDGNTNYQIPQNTYGSRQRRRRQNRTSRLRRQSSRQQNSYQLSGSIPLQRTPPPLPFILPIWIANKMDELRNRTLVGRFANETQENLGSNGFLSGITSNLSSLFWTSSGGDSLLDRAQTIPSSPRTTYRSLLVSSPHSPGGSSHRDSDEEHDPSMHEEDTRDGEMQLPGLIVGEIPVSPRADGLRRRAASTSSNSSPVRQSEQSNTPQSSSSNSSSSSTSSLSPTSRYNNSSINNIGNITDISPVGGNARMNYSISPPHTPVQNQNRSILQSRRNGPPSPNAESSSSSLMYSSQSSSTSSDEEIVFGGNYSRGGRGGTTRATSLAQRAIRMQHRVSQRMNSSIVNRPFNQSRSGIDSDSRYDEISSAEESGGDESDDENSQSFEVSSSSSSASSDNDPYSGGCSQKNVYFLMRLSLIVAVLHVLILLCLHVTYVGPFAFRKHKPSHIRRYLTGIVNRIRMGTGNEKGAATNGFFSWPTEFDDTIDESHQDNIINCISYALSSRPVEDRGDYFAMFGDGENTDTASRRLIEIDDYEYLFDDEEYSMSNDDVDDEGNIQARAINPMFLSNFDSKSQRAMPVNSVSSSREGSPLLGKDEILQIKIMYGRKCTGRCSRVRHVEYPTNEETISQKIPFDAEQSGHKVRSVRSITVSADGNESIDMGYDGESGFRLRGRKRRAKHQNPIKDAFKSLDPTLEIHDASLETLSKSSGGMHNIVDDDPQVLQSANALDSDDWVLNKHDMRKNRRRLDTKTEETDEDAVKDHVDEDQFSSPSYWEKPHYRFSIDDALLFMDTKSAYLHNITLVNITVTERCLSTGSDDGKLSFFSTVGEFLSQIYGMDSVIINQLMYGIRAPDGSFQGGHMQSMETKERWGWRKDQLDSYEPDWSIFDWLLKKIGILSMSLLAFFLITSVTSLIVRVLTSSGVVLMFPLFSCFRAFGMPGADERILALSYPWIGHARGSIAQQRIHPQSHLVWAHIAKIILYYVMYEACQAAWSVVLYAKSIPEALPVWIYGFAMIWEYFSMVFVRSALSVHFFPRATLAYFVLYHTYFYSVPYGYFDVALIPLFLFMAHMMLYTILALEAPNAARGTISVECPREVYNKLSWPEWNAQLPSEWTMFLPLNSRQTPLHDREIPDSGSVVAIQGVGAQATPDNNEIATPPNV